MTRMSRARRAASRRRGTPASRESGSSEPKTLGPGLRRDDAGSDHGHRRRTFSPRPLVEQRSRLWLPPRARRHRVRGGAGRLSRGRAVRALDRAAQPLRPRHAQPPRLAHAAARLRGRATGVLPRHRRPGPRRAFRDHVRDPDLAPGRRRGGGAGGGARRQPGAGLGLHGWSPRRLHHARCRRATLVPRHPDRAPDRRDRARGAPSQRARRRGAAGADRRDRRFQLAAVRPHRARLDAGREEQGVRAGRAGDRGPVARHRLPASAPERARAGACAGDHQHRDRDRAQPRCLSLGSGYRRRVRRWGR